MRVILAGEISIETLKGFADLVNTVKADKPEKVEILFDSPGGNSEYTEMFRTLIRQIQGLTHLVAINVSNCDSAALDLFMCFDYREATKNATFLIHRAKHSFEDATATNIIKTVKMTEKLENEWFNNFFALRIMAGMTEREIKKVKKIIDNGGDYVITYDEAQKWGIIR